VTPPFTGYPAIESVRLPESRTFIPGQAVQVWCRSMRCWVDGFVVVDFSSEGCRVQRSSDGYELPVRFSLDEISYQRPGPTKGW
jgi:hypothetical protein